MSTWVQILTVGTNLSILILAAKIIRHLTILEFKVNMMWEVYHHVRNNKKETE